VDSADTQTYNHIVRSSQSQHSGLRTATGRQCSKDERKAHARSTGRQRTVISDAHTDFTRASGPTVLRCVHPGCV
jgi:hypothetical protein